MAKPQVLAEPAQGSAVPPGKLAAEVGGRAVVADGDVGELGPPLAGPGGEALTQ